jgi:hypothetical protein
VLVKTFSSNGIKFENYLTQSTIVFVMQRLNKNVFKQLYKRNVYGTARPPLPDNEPNVTKFFKINSLGSFCTKFRFQNKFNNFTEERIKVLNECKKMRSETLEIPVVIDGKEVRKEVFKEKV